jgi:hypothetical protein
MTVSDDINEQILCLLTAPQDLSIDNLHRSALQCVLLVLSLIPLPINLFNKTIHHYLCGWLINFDERTRKCPTERHSGIVRYLLKSASSPD